MTVKENDDDDGIDYGGSNCNDDDDGYGGSNDG